ncbi:MAG TPA: tannase/feruloyl esterase family alpha/beta hydrolase, partial [Candidatus Limnocylindria bacterium]|nr:tannase/feruloyl esterase family alpha/beta hydrolase [Candidatus Limnocylindria bacterium]
REIWKGPHRQDGSFMWYGLPRGADLSVLAATAGSPLRGKPEGLDWIRYCGLLDPDWQWTTITRGKFELLWNQMAEQYGEVLGNEHPDLKRFRELGHRLIIFHGLADPIVPVEGSIAYYERLQTKSSRVADFVRLFLAPGYGHGYSSTGPTPVGEMDAIIRWVEAHEAPDQLKAIQWDPHGKVIGSRLLDRFPGNQN